MAWNYLDTTLPATFVRGGGAVQAVYALDSGADSLNDLSGNGHTLTAGAGAAAYTTVDGFVGFAFDGATNIRTASSAALQITGALTAEAICQFNRVHATNYQKILGYGWDDTEVSSSNWIYSLNVMPDTLKWYYSQEYGSGSDSEYFLAAMATVGDVFHVALTRNTAGTTVCLYVNKLRVGRKTTMTAPTGGSSGRLQFGGNPEAGASNRAYMNGVLFSARISSGEMTATQVAESYARVRGLAQ